jgi:2-oxoglutarate ferredoxin oxidoreductase subunit beta
LQSWVVNKLIAEVIEEMGIQDKTVGVSPVGCAVFMYDYIDVDFMEAAHGKAPAVATGYKVPTPISMCLPIRRWRPCGNGTGETFHAVNRGEIL